MTESNAACSATHKLAICSSTCLHTDLFRHVVCRMHTLHISVFRIAVRSRRLGGIKQERKDRIGRNQFMVVHVEQGLRVSLGDVQGSCVVPVLPEREMPIIKINFPTCAAHLLKANTATTRGKRRSIRTCRVSM